MQLSAEQISKYYFRNHQGANHFYAVKQTDFALPPGKLTVLHGRSGSGKTTFLHMLAGILKPDTGKVLADRKDLWQMDDREQSRFRSLHIALVPQRHLKVQNLNVLENILLPLSLHQTDAADGRVDELLAYFQMEHLKTAFPDELSGGELRRMNLVRALAFGTEVLLADEPTADLDGENTKRVFQMLRARADEGAAVLLVTHEPQAAEYADETLEMRDGVLTVQ